MNETIERRIRTLAHNAVVNRLSDHAIEEGVSVVVKAAVAEERERCAKIADNICRPGADEAAEVIRHSPEPKPTWRDAPIFKECPALYKILDGADIDIPLRFGLQELAIYIAKKEVGA